MDVFNEQVYIIKTQLNYTYSYIVWFLSDQKKTYIALLKVKLFNITHCLIQCTASKKEMH